MLLLVSGIAVAQKPAPQQEVICTAILEVPNVCCGKESGPAIAELSKIPGVVKVVPDYKTRNLTIMHAYVQRHFSPSHLETVERAKKVPPTELATVAGTYKSKP